MNQKRNPFIFQRPVSAKEIIGREKTLDDLLQHAVTLQNIMLLSPRGWGKRSLSTELAYRIWRYHSQYRVCHVDLSDSKGQGDVLMRFTEAFYRIPGLTHPLEEMKSFKGMDIFAFPDLLALRNHVKLIVLISGMQHFLNIIGNPPSLKEFCSILQYNEHCAYVFLQNTSSSGSLSEISYHGIRRFMKVFWIKKIESETWTSFLLENFRKSRKEISATTCETLSSFTFTIPYYTQMLAWHAWEYTCKECTEDTLKLAIEAINAHQRLAFESAMDTLTSNQRKIARSIAEDPFEPFSLRRRKNLAMLNGGSIARALEGLQKKGIIIKDHGSPAFSNPFFRLWILQESQKRKSTDMW